MTYQFLGHTDIKISRIGFGCMSMKPGADDNEAILRAAVDGGINYFDTADLYDKGENEKLLGRAVKAVRQRLVIATKVGNQWRPDGSGWDWNPTQKYILTAVEESLTRLDTDYIDLYQLHGGTIDDPVEEIIEAFELLQQQGKIRQYGISSIRPNVIQKWVALSNMASVMMQYSLLDRRPEEAMLPLLLSKGISVLARGSVAQGLLIDKPPKEYLGFNAERVTEAKGLIHSLSGKDRTPAQTAVQFTLQHPAVTAAVTGIRTREQLAEALAVTDTRPLYEEEREMIKSSSKINYYTEHRGGLPNPSGGGAQAR